VTDTKRDRYFDTVTTVGLRWPPSRPLMYCWLKPEISANRSCVRPFFCLIRLTFCPTSLRMSMQTGQRITYSKFINYNMWNTLTLLGSRRKDGKCACA
jgi:hypothetical protein